MVDNKQEKIPFGSGEWEQRKVPVSKLDLDLQNARFRDDAVDQAQAMEFMLSVAGEKCLGLLKDLCMVGDLNPSDLPIVFPEKNRYRVLEGNRRLTCLKIWRKPALLDNLPSDLQERYKSRFESVIRKAPHSPPEKISVVVVDSIHEADTWIDKKHGLGKGSGASTVEWDSFEKDRRLYRQNNTKTQAFSFVDMLNVKYRDDDEMMRNLSTLLNVQYTILDRILSNSIMRDEIGVRYQVGGRTHIGRTAEEMRPFFARFLYELAERKQDSRSLRTTKDVSSFLLELREDTLVGEVQNPPGGGNAFTQSPNAMTTDDGRGEKTNPDASPSETQAQPATEAMGPKKKSRQRNTSAKVFTNLDLDGFSPKTAELVKNTAKLSVKANPVVVAVLLRVLLDITCYQFLDRFGGYKQKQNPPRDLEKRITTVLIILDPRAADQLKTAEGASIFNALYHSVKNDPNNLKLLQFSVHSSDWSATTSETKELASRFEPMLVAMNEKMKQNESS